MKFYPVAILKSPRSAYGVTVLDIPGCFSAGDTLDEALPNVQEAVEVHLYNEELAPEPSMVLGTVLPHSCISRQKKGLNNPSGRV